MKKIFFYLICGVVFSQCNKIEEIGQGSNAVFIDEAASSNSIVVTMPEDSSSSTLNITPKLVYTTPQAIDIEFSVDTSLIASYNSINKTDYVAIPSINYSMLETSTTVSANNATAAPIRIKFNRTDTLNRIHKYIIPVTIKSVSGGMSTISSSKTIYYVVDNSVLVNTAAVLTSNYFTPNFATSLNASKVRSLSNFTFESLVNVNSFRTDGSEAGISTLMGIEGYFLLRFGDSGLDPNKLQVAMASGNISTNYSLPTNKWFHVAVTYDGTNLKIYIDGTLISTTTRKLTALNLTSITDRFYIGRSFNDARWLDGDICECRIWNVARTADQIGGDNMYRVDPKSTGLVAYWKFNEGSGNTAKDHSGNGFDAVSASNASWVTIKLPQ